MKIIANETSGFRFKRYVLLGMSGLGRHLSLVSWRTKTGGHTIQ